MNKLSVTPEMTSWHPQPLPPQTESDSSTHRVLRIAEILQKIFGFLVGKNLLALAMTCRCFQDTALEILWGDSTISTAMMLQPLKAMGVLEAKELQLHASRPPSTQEFSRFLTYIRRIKSLNLKRPPIHPTAFEIVFGKTQIDLPRLRKLVCLIGHHDDPMQFLTFMNGSLKDLEIILHRTGHLPTWIECLQAIPNRCPRLSTVVIVLPRGAQASIHDREINQDLGGILPRLQHIRSAKIMIPGGVSRSFFQQLGHAPLLTDLWILTCWSVHPFDQGGPLRPSFSNLEYLRVILTGTVQTLNNFHNLLSACSESPLRWLYIHLPKDNLTSASSSVKHTLQAYSDTNNSRSYLKVLRLTPIPSKPSPRFTLYDNHRITISDLNPLLRRCFQNLEELRLELPLIYDLTNDDLILLGGHLPNVTGLSLAHNMGDVMKDWPVPLVTLRGLIGLANKCPRLKHLALAVDLFPTPDLSELPSSNSGQVAPALSTWNVVNSHVREAEAVGMILATRLPCLHDLHEMEFSWAESQNTPQYSFMPLDPSDPWVERSHHFRLMGRFISAAGRMPITSPRSLEALRLLWATGP